MTINPDIIGYMAATLGTICWVPQTVKTWRTRHTKDLSLAGYSVTLAMLILWLSYGLMVGSLPIIAGNVLSVVFVGSILSAKLIYG